MEPILSHSSFEVFPSACLSTVSFVVLSEKIVGLASTDLSGPASHPFAPDVSSVTALCVCSSVWHTGSGINQKVWDSGSGINRKFCDSTRGPGPGFLAQAR